MDLNAGQLTRRIYSGLMQWTNGAYEESWTFVGMSLSEMPTPVALPTSHDFHPSLSPLVWLSLGILHEWMRTQMLLLAKPSSNLLQRTGSNRLGGRAQLGWRTFLMTCLRWILDRGRESNPRPRESQIQRPSNYATRPQEIWRKIGLSGDWCLCTALSTRSGSCYYWIGTFIPIIKYVKIRLSIHLWKTLTLTLRDAKHVATEWSFLACGLQQYISDESWFYDVFQKTPPSIILYNPVKNEPILIIFTARCYASAVLAMALCPSVCPSQVGVLLKRLNVGSHKQHHTIAQGL